MIVYITRHGQIDPRQEVHVGNRPISELGRRQAGRLAERLAEAGFRGRVFVSPYLRCLETADIICRRLGLAFRPEPAMREMNGPWIKEFAGLRDEEIKRMFATCAGDAGLEYPWWTPEPETHSDVLKRVGAFLDSLLPGATTDILLVGHGATAEAAYEHLTGSNDFPDGHYNCALTAVRVRPERSVLHANFVEHLGQGEVTSNERVIA